MHRLLALFLFALGCATGPVITQAEPQLLVVTRPAAEVIALAGAHLVRNGFEVTTSDAASGLVTAKRVRSARESIPMISCKLDPTTGHENSMRTTITASVSATARSDGTHVTVLVRVLTEFPMFPDPPPPSEKWCASNGSAEKALISALAP